MILRVGLGVVLAAHGLQKLFGWWGGQGLTGFKNSLSDVGYQHADILAYVSAGGEIVSGALLVLGLFTPVAAAGALAFLINGLLVTISAKPHSHNLTYFLPDGHEYQITLIVIAVAVILAGPGPLRPGRWPGLGLSTVHRVVRRAGLRHRRRCRRLGAAQRCEPDRLTPLTDRGWAPVPSWLRSTVAASRK